MNEYLPRGNCMKAKDWPDWEAFDSGKAAIFAKIQKVRHPVMQLAVMALCRFGADRLRLKLKIEDESIAVVDAG